MAHRPVRELLVGDTVIGHVGEPHPPGSEPLGLPLRTSVMELGGGRAVGPGVPVTPRVSSFPPVLLTWRSWSPTRSPPPTSPRR
ncbi:hypothetical protein [Blastococcus sp. SYSU DS1021]